MTYLQRHPLPRLRPTHAARRRALRRAWEALLTEEKHGRVGEAAVRCGDTEAAGGRLRGMDAHRDIAMRWLRVASGGRPAGDAA